MRLKKLQLVLDQAGQLDISGETKTARILRTFHSEIGARSVLRVLDDVLRTDELW